MQSQQPLCITPAATMSHLYIVKPLGTNDFKFGISGDPAARVKSYRTITSRGMECVHILQHPLAANLERCLREFLIVRGALVFHPDTGRPSEMAAAGEGDHHLNAALSLAISAGARLCPVPAAPATQEDAATDTAADTDSDTAADTDVPQPATEHTDAPGQIPQPASAAADAIVLELAAAAATLAPFDVATYALLALTAHDFSDISDLRYYGKGLWKSKARSPTGDADQQQQDPPWLPITNGETHLLQTLATHIRASVTAANAHDDPSLHRLSKKLVDRTFRKSVLADLADICTHAEPEVSAGEPATEPYEESLVAEWMQRHVRVTGNKEDFLLLGDLVKRYYADEQLCRKMCAAKFKILAKAFMGAVALSFKEKDNVYVNKQRVNRGHVAKGVCFV